MTLREAAQHALEALQLANTREWPENRIGAAINTLSAALAEPEQDDTALRQQAIEAFEAVSHNDIQQRMKAITALAEPEPTNECLLCKKGLRYVVKRRVKKIMQDAPDLTPIEKLEADLRRLANRYDTLSFERYKNEGHASPMFHSYRGQHYAYIAAAEKVRMLRSLLDLSPNVIIKNGKEK
jgi:hypothetical protein